MKTHSKGDFLFAMKFAWQQCTKYYDELTAMVDMVKIGEHILIPFQMLWSFMKLELWIDINH